MTRSIVIVAGGQGLRMQSDLPKQFLLLRGLPVLMRTLNQFAKAFDRINIVLVLPEEHMSYWKDLCGKFNFTIDHVISKGGETRFESVKNGLAQCPSEGVIGIHDGVRPLATERLIQRCFSSAENQGSGLPVVPISQSLRKQEGSNSQAIDRSGMMSVQTPQCFDGQLIKAAYDRAFDDRFTDDATVFEAAGNKIALVDGEETNLKITTQADLKIAEAILGASQA